jgi:hypothetical protein
MEFFIRKDSLEPILKMELVRDGRTEFDTFHDKLENSTIRFSMKSVDDGTYRISKSTSRYSTKNSIITKRTNRILHLL